MCGRELPDYFVALAEFGMGCGVCGLLASMFKESRKRMRTAVDVKRQNGLRKQRFYRAGQEFGPKGCGAGTGLPCGRVVIGYVGEAGPEMPVTRLQRSGYEASVGSGTIIENSKS